ncbi:MAG: hypothetical protein ACREJM_04510, partial [Candidatus Saccharimonadales bacterium]
IFGGPAAGLGSTTNGGLPMSGFGGSTFGGSTFGNNPLGTPFTGVGGSTFGSGTTFGTRTPGPYGISGVGPAPGVSSFSGVGMTPAQFLYYSNRNRLTNSNSLAPVAVGGGYYQLGGIGSYWLSPSGYYYPWGTGTSTGYPAQVIYVLQQGSIGEAKPAVSTLITDLRKFLLDAKSQQQLDLTAVESFSSRLTDIETRAANLAANNGGVLDASDDVSIRRELDSLITDITQALHT